jgi:hypothetical protein
MLTSDCCHCEGGQKLCGCFESDMDIPMNDHELNGPGSKVDANASVHDMGRRLKRPTPLWLVLFTRVAPF